MRGYSASGDLLRVKLKIMVRAQTDARIGNCWGSRVNCEIANPDFSILMLGSSTTSRSHGSTVAKHHSCP